MKLCITEFFQGAWTAQAWCSSFPVLSRRRTLSINATRIVPPLVTPSLECEIQPAASCYMEAVHRVDPMEAGDCERVDWCWAQASGDAVGMHTPPVPAAHGLANLSKPGITMSWNETGNLILQPGRFRLRRAHFQGSFPNRPTYTISDPDPQQDCKSAPQRTRRRKRGGRGRRKHRSELGWVGCFEGKGRTHPKNIGAFVHTDSESSANAKSPVAVPFPPPALALPMPCANCACA